MSLHRLRATVAYPTSSGLAVWSRDQMAVRHQQAVHINPGAANEETPANEVTDLGDGTSIFRCDLPLLNEAAAVDALATLTTASVWLQAVALSDAGLGPTPSWVEHHTCQHDTDPPGPCVVVTRVTTT